MSWAAYTPETVHGEIDLDADLTVSPPLEQLHPDVRGQLEDVLEVVNSLIGGKALDGARGFRVSMSGHVNTPESHAQHGGQVTEMVSLNIQQAPLETPADQPGRNLTL